jgi:hypothetical protein
MVGEFNLFISTAKGAKEKEDWKPQMNADGRG